MVHPLDALLRDVVNPVARERGYTRKGRNYYRYNDNGDAAHVNVQLLGSSTEFRIEAGISGHLGRVNRSREHDFRSGRGLWSWMPSGRGISNDRGTNDLWEIDAPAIDGEFRSFWIEMLDVLDSLLEPGALTAELRQPSDRFPGNFARSDLHLAYSMLNDGGLPAATTELLVRRIALASPVWGRELQIGLAGEKS